MMINYGMDKMKFGQAVLAGQSVRLVASLHSLTNLRGVAKARLNLLLKLRINPRKHSRVLPYFCTTSINEVWVSL